MSIPIAVKKAVWNYHFPDSEEGKCIACHGKIIRSEHHCGHIVSKKNGGPVKLENLVPMCATCNTSIGGKNLVEFMKEFGYDIPPLLKEAEKLLLDHNTPTTNKNADEHISIAGSSKSVSKTKDSDHPSVSWTNVERPQLLFALRALDMKTEEDTSTIQSFFATYVPISYLLPKLKLVLSNCPSVSFDNTITEDNILEKLINLKPRVRDIDEVKLAFETMPSNYKLFLTIGFNSEIISSKMRAFIERILIYQSESIDMLYFGMPCKQWDDLKLFIKLYYALNGNTIKGIFSDTYYSIYYRTKKEQLLAILPLIQSEEGMKSIKKERLHSMAEDLGISVLKNIRPTIDKLMQEE